MKYELFEKRHLAIINWSGNKYIQISYEITELKHTNEKRTKIYKMPTAPTKKKLNKVIIKQINWQDEDVNVNKNWQTYTIKQRTYGNSQATCLSMTLK